MSISNSVLQEWVSTLSRHLKPDRVHWCDGSEEEYRLLVAEMLRKGVLQELNPKFHPGCYLHRSHSTDVARTEHLTFICSREKGDAGPTNHWMSPDEAQKKVSPLFDGCMKGRTMYVVPYLMGPAGSPYSKVGIEITDSPYVVANMKIMTRMGRVALDHLGESTDFCRGLHSLGDLDPHRRFICHFPDTREIWSIGSGYGGNALLGKKCFALRIASVQGRDEGWLAEHMLIVGVQNPKGVTRYLAAAFPSACGKTNLAMLVPPKSMPGWKVWTVGDDICWMRFGADGRLYAINPEAGFFGVVPGTSRKTNPNAVECMQKNTIFTNVAVTEEGIPWWEGKDGDPPAKAFDWQGRPWTPSKKDKAAHPNSRFTAPARQCPSVSPEFDNPNGVPISAIIFGGRRARVAPLVYQSFDWAHGVYVGASMASETTAAQTGAVGVVRRDPMAMLPFCGYNMADYFGHWLRMGSRGSQPPKIFHVNWFRTDEEGRFLWPGFGENLRVLAWVLERVEGRGGAVESPIGWLPTPEAIPTAGLDISTEKMRKLLEVDRGAWLEDLKDQAHFFSKFGKRLPSELADQMRRLEQRFSAAQAP